MNGGGNFFVENAFGEVYEGTFFAEDLRKISSSSSISAANIKKAAFNSATSQVRMPTESEVLRESNMAFLSACNLDHFLSKSYSTQFAGKIFSNF